MASAEETVREHLRCWEDLRQRRYLREGEWQEIADFFMPRKGFQITPQPMELVRRRVTSSLGPRSLSRSAGLFVGYLIDPSKPFIGPNVERGMIAAGRPTGLDAKSTDFLEKLAWAMFDRMLLPQSNFMASVSRLAMELLGFGTGVMWVGRKRGFGPHYMHRPLRSCWIACDEHGVVDTLYFREVRAAWRVIQKWPEAKNNDQISTKAAAEHQEQTKIEILHCVQPRKGGRRGAYAEEKPFSYCVIAINEKLLLEESGYDSFPYAVPRLNVEEGSDYGTGLAWWALPDVKVYNALMQGTELAVALRNNPPLMKPSRLFGKPLDRRPGAVNTYDQAALGFQSAKEAIQRLDIAGDVEVGATWMKALSDEVEQIFYIDWMQPNTGVQKTATEIIDTRDLRVRAMTALIPAVDRDLLGCTADRTLEAMLEENQLGHTPEQLRGMPVDWDYWGPLAMYQRQGAAEAIEKLFAATVQAQQFDPHAGLVLAVSEGLRSIGESLGVPIGVLRSREEEAQLRASAQQAQQDTNDVTNTATAAGAFNQSAQGVGALANAAGAPPQQPALEAA